AYQSVATQFDKDRKLAATAIFRLGEVYRKQGKTNEATAQYERIVREFSDQPELVKLSRNYAQRSELPVVQNKLLVDMNSEEAEITRIKTLIKDSPDLINARSSGRTLLDQAAQQNRLKVSEFLLVNGADVNRANASGSSVPLHQAAGSGHKSMVELLLAHGADTEARDDTGGTALHIASQSGFKAIAEMLLKNKANVNAKNSPANGGQTPLHLAATAGHRAVVELLLANDVNANIRDDRGLTPLHLAVTAKNLDMANFLIAQKADVNAITKDGWTALLQAVDIRQTRLVELLLKNGANVEVKIPQYQIRDAKNNRSDTVFNFSPLHIAAQSGQREIAEMLLDAKANPNPTDPGGETPLHYAASFGSAEIVEVLIKHGAVVDSRNNKGWTPLTYAIGRSQISTTELLLANKADPNIQVNTGETPLGLAKQRNNPMEQELVGLLLKYGANENFERLTRISTKRAGKENPVFIKGNQPLNRYTIIELIVGAQLPFPDLANVKIERLEDGGKKSQMIPVNVEDILKSGDCSKNLWLEWGDIIEVPELDHNVNEQWVGYSKQHAEAVQKCLEKNVSITIKGETTNSILRAHINLNSGQVTLPDTSLIGVVGRFLRASSDSNRIKVKRIDPVTKRSHEIVSDLEKAKGLRLIEGDQIEIPERDPNAPVPAANTGLPAIPPSAPSALITF
ncbi:MAG: ankyrin repeat domain-containing protein, partial [Verrucomicrobiota bacterium]